MNINSLSTEPTLDNNQKQYQPKVSIIVPVYNAGEHLRPCLDTLVNQTLREIEIICVLDCPTDGSDKVVEEYAAKDGRIVVIKNEKNLNIGESRNVGLRAARGEYIGFSDHDDTRELDMYEKLYSATENGKKNIIFSGDIVDSILNHEFPTYIKHAIIERINQLPLYQQLFYMLVPRGSRNYKMHITPNLYSRHFIIQHDLHFVDTKYCSSEDKLFLLAAIAEIQDDNEISLLNHQYYLYNLNQNSTSETNWYKDSTHVINHQYYLFNLAKKIKWIDTTIYNSIFPILQISDLYSCFICDMKRNGFTNSYKSYRKLFCFNAIFKEIASTAPWGIKGLPPTKRLFLLWVKSVSR